ncbi:MAG: hypothetical protein R3F17_13980 [Planctomycetota bacterium]
MRQVYTLRLGAGSIGTDGDVLPAEGWPMVRGLRVSLPEVLPNASLPAGPLLESLANPDSSAPARMERLARLRPSEYGVALEGCREALLAATPEIFERYRPALAWLCFHRPQPQGLPAWRAHLATEHDPKRDQALWEGR